MQINSIIQNKDLKTIIFNKSLDDISNYFSIFSDSSRIKIFFLLCHFELCVLNISEFMQMTMPAVSHHLKILKKADFIESFRDGKEVFYKIKNNEQTNFFHECIEKYLKINCPDFKNQYEKINELSEYKNYQIEIIKKVHDFLCEDFSKRYTIEDLAKKFAINTTSLKTVFRDVYGTSIQAHIKKHRMEKAQELLKNSDLQINQIANSVGYESQGKFSSTFKEFFGKSPNEFKKQ